MRLDVCKHWAGTVEGKCDAGVRYADVSVSKQWTVYTIPCFPARCPSATCDKREMPTQEEIDADQEFFEKMLRRSMLVRDAIVAHTGGKRGMTGSIPCPACETGTVKFSVAGVNGHIWAACSTEDCVRFAE